MKSQAKIIKALYGDKVFEFMAYRELRRKTGLQRLSLSRNLKELCTGQESQLRNGFLNPEMWQAIELDNYEMFKDGYATVKGPIKHPMLMTKDGVYKLHPSTRIDLDEGKYPYIISKKAKRKAKRLIKERRGNRDVRYRSRLDDESNREER